MAKHRESFVIRYTGDLIPERECLSKEVPVLLRRQTVALTAEGIVDRAVHGQKALGMAG